MEIAEGSVVVFGLKKLRCVEKEHIQGSLFCNEACFFTTGPLHTCDPRCVGLCTKDLRSDGKDVVFVDTADD